MRKEYVATGLVYGKTWGGGYGAYKSEGLNANTKEGLLKQAKKDLKSGALDSGFGFESLKGAILDIEEKIFVTVEGKEYQRSEFEIEVVGDLTEKEQDFLTDSLLQN